MAFCANPAARGNFTFGTVGDTAPTHGRLGTQPQRTAATTAGDTAPAGADGWGHSPWERLGTQPQRGLVARKRGVMPASLPPVLSQLGLAPESWCQLVGRFGEMFFSVAGQPTVIDSARSRLCQRRFRVRPAARKLFCDAN